jgi:hypothetical protein
MRRSTLILVLGAGLMATAAGCSSGGREGPWTAQKWQQAKKHDQQRLAGWDAQRPTGFWGGVMAIWHTPGRLIDYYSGNTPLVAARQMFDPTDADHRRLGINYLSDRSWGREGSYLSAYAHIAESDPDYLARATAVRALNRSRDHKAVPLLLEALEDKDDLVRIEAAKALANIPDSKAVPALQRHLSDAGESRDVRIACADALREYKTLGVAQVLIRQLQDREFAVAWQATRSLRFMLGKDLQYDQARWLGYLTGSDRPLG